MTTSIPIPARDPKFWAEVGDGPARWYAALRNGDVIRFDDEFEQLAKGGWAKSQTYAPCFDQKWNSITHVPFRRPLADPISWEQVELIVEAMRGMSFRSHTESWDEYHHPVTEEVTRDRDVARSWLKALGNSQAAVDGSRQHPPGTVTVVCPACKHSVDVRKMTSNGVCSWCSPHCPDDHLRDIAEMPHHASPAGAEFAKAVEVYHQAKRRTEAERNHLAVHPANRMAAVEMAWSLQQQLAAESAALADARREVERLRGVVLELREISHVSP